MGPCAFDGNSGVVGIAGAAVTVAVSRLESPVLKRQYFRPRAWRRPSLPAPG